MSYGETENFGLVFKWRDSEQGTPLFSTNRFLIRTIYGSLVRQSVGKDCLIYVPAKGSNENPHQQARFVARAILAEVEATDNPKRLALHFANIKTFPYLVARQFGNEFLETGRLAGDRDFSRDQKIVRPIDLARLEKISSMGFTGRFNDKIYPFELLPNISVSRNIFLDLSEENQGLIPGQTHVDVMTRSSGVRRKTYELDEARCVISGATSIYRGRALGIQIAHLWPLGYGGPDNILNTVAMHSVLNQLYDMFAFTLSDDFR